jgi:hypothetical protein
MIKEYNRELNSPKTHVLIIGVGGYPHLPAGTQYREQTFFRGLGQLSSAAYSAAAFYRTIEAIDQRGEWIAPLGSVEVLISPVQGQELDLDGFEAKNPTRAAIADSYRTWKQRSEEHPDNIAIFYFSGHGIEKDNQFLLAADFNPDPDVAKDGAFDIDRTISAFKRSRIGTKLFLIDSCRSGDIRLLTTDFTPGSLGSVDYLQPEFGQMLVQKAKGVGASAYGPKDGESLYCRAITAAFNGAVANNDEGAGWKVNVSDISSKVSHILENMPENKLANQGCWNANNCMNDIIKLVRAPQLPMIVKCDPDAALPHAKFDCYDLDKDAHLCEREPHPSEWLVHVRAGYYRLSATFQAGSYNNARQNHIARPPFSKCQIKCG